MEKISLYIIVLLSLLLGKLINNLLVPTDLKCEYLVNPIGVDSRNPRFTWKIDADLYDFEAKSFQIFLGTDSVAVIDEENLIWKSNLMDNSKQLVRYGGEKLQSAKKYYWKVNLESSNNVTTSSKVASFVTGILDDTGWKGNWISDGMDYNLNPAPLFRKEFKANREIKSAYAFIATAGLYELSINGKKVGDHLLDPMFTRYDRRNLYVGYDVTKLIESGDNALGVILGNGWFNHQSKAVWAFDQAPWRGRPKFCFDLLINYLDGSEEIIKSEEDWKTSTSSIIFNSIYTGEHHDSRLFQKGWDNIGFDDSKWVNARVVGSPSKNIVSQNLHPIGIAEKIPALTCKRIDETTYLYDFGKNMSGITQFKVKGVEGTSFKIVHSEQLGPDGRVDLSNINVHFRPTDNSDLFQTDIYTIKGINEEVFNPKFNYKGFRYAQVSADVPITLKRDNLTAFFLHNNVPESGKISSSNEMLNNIWAATNRTYLSNLFGYPTDCPQREKNGWTGDAHINIETGLYNFDAITIYEKWMDDHLDEQQPNGVLPAIIPSNGWGYHWANGPDWTSTITLIPWNIYMFYGDVKILEDCYSGMKKYVDHITDMSPNGLTSWGLGDWVPVTSKPVVEFTSSVYYFVDANILSRTAKILGYDSDYNKYSNLAEKIKHSINIKYLNTDSGIYGSGMQTELSMALKWKIVPDELITLVAKRLVTKIKEDDMHINVGLLGSKTILDALSENGYAQLAFQLATSDSYPSWGYWIKNGATTLYENWNLDAKSDLSQNHIMFGEISAWFYKGLGGIYPDELEPGFKNVVLKPNFVQGLNFFNSEHTGPYGKIISAWERKGKHIIYKVSVPGNSSSTVYLSGDYFLEGNQRLEKNNRISIIKKDSGTIQLQLKSGSYEFKIKQ